MAEDRPGFTIELEVENVETAPASEGRKLFTFAVRPLIPPIPATVASMGPAADVLRFDVEVDAKILEDNESQEDARTRILAFCQDVVTRLVRDRLAIGHAIESMQRVTLRDRAEAFAKHARSVNGRAVPEADLARVLDAELRAVFGDGYFRGRNVAEFSRARADQRVAVLEAGLQELHADACRQFASCEEIGDPGMHQAKYVRDLAAKTLGNSTTSAPPADDDAGDPGRPE